MDSLNNLLPSLVGDRVIIRLPNKEDIKEISSYYQVNKEHLEPFEPVKSENFYTEAHWEEQVKTRLTEYNEGKSVRMFIFLRDSPEKVIGNISINQIARGAFQACAIGYSLAADRQGQGYMTESLKLIIDYVFNELNLHRMMANYLPHNRRSGNTLKRLGFTIEGYAQNYLKINGEWEDHILTSLTNNNWMEKDEKR